MIKHILKTHQGDLLEFDMTLYEVPDVVPREEKPRALYDGEQAFFETDPENDKDPESKRISITQPSLHFTIPSVDLAPGQYPFRAGVILEGGERQTVFYASESVLMVGR